MIVDERFCGPPGTGNGGYVAGLAAAHVGGSARVTLRVPPPLGRAMAVERDGSSVRVTDGGTVVVEAEPALVEVDTPSPVGYDAALDAMSRTVFRDGGHPFPTCFVCGPDRAPGDGLRLAPGDVGDGVAATAWVPDDSLAADDGRVRPEILWAALDCPSYFGATVSMPDPPTAVLGRITARVDARPRPGDRLVVLGWGLGADGRKIRCASAVTAEDGAVLAVAEALWLIVPAG